MAHAGRLSTTLLVVCVAAALSCIQGKRDESGTTAENPPRPDKCADFNGVGNGVVRGNLRGKGQSARAVAAQIQGVDANGKDHPSQGVRLIPTCDNRTLTPADLFEGRFVGFLTGQGLDDIDLSNTPNDIVAWWVYGEVSGSQMIWHSQFLSLRGPANSEPKNDRLIICAPPVDHAQDKVEWHNGICPSQADSAAAGDQDTVTVRGDKPWFGCTLGCCFSAMNIS